MHHDIPREALASLAQHDFAVVPPGTARTLETFFEGLGSSRPNEKAFNATKDWGRRNKGSRMVSRVNRHYLPSSKRVLQAEFERAEVAALPGARILARDTRRDVPRVDFEALDGSPSLPDENLLAAMRPPDVSFPCTNAQGLHKQVAAWRLLRACNAGDVAWTSVGAAWHA